MNTANNIRILLLSTKGPAKGNADKRHTFYKNLGYQSQEPVDGDSEEERNEERKRRLLMEQSMWNSFGGTGNSHTHGVGETAFVEAWDYLPETLRKAPHFQNVDDTAGRKDKVTNIIDNLRKLYNNASASRLATGGGAR